MELTEGLRAALPPRFEAVGEALASGMGAVDACAVVGRELALDGVSLDEALAGLEATSGLVRGTSPAYADARALAGAWGEATLGYLHRLTCEDPVTGLASLAHLQSRLSELYRGELRDRLPGETLALVVVDVAGPDRLGQPAPTEVLASDLRVLRFAEVARAVLGADRALGRVGRDRIVAIAPRDARLADRVALLRRMLDRLRAGDPQARVWVEGLPASPAGAAATLDELARL